MTATKHLPVFLLTGFLGSGKTTLLNAALRMAPLANTAVIVNELGEIGLDHLIVAESNDNVILLDGGCLCCANTGALHETLSDLAFRRLRKEVPPFERVIIETSGVADPAPLLNVLLGHPLVTNQYALEATICVVDAQHFVHARTKYPELDKQAAVADRIVITKSDLADPAPVKQLLQDLNPQAEVMNSIAEAFATASARPLRFAPAKIGATHSHGGGFRAFCFRPAGPVTWAGWSAWTRLAASQFGERLVRVKGLLKMEDSDEVALVHGVQGVFHPPQRFKDWPGGDAGNRLACIGRDLTEAELRVTLRALNAPAGTQVVYTFEDLEKEQAHQ